MKFISKYFNLYLMFNSEYVHTLKYGLYVINKGHN